MIQVRFIRDSSIRVSGHSGYAENGYDIVCEAVTCLCSTLVASLENLTTDRLYYTLESGLFYLDIRHLSRDAMLLVNAFYIGIRLLADAYPRYVGMTEQ